MTSKAPVLSNYWYVVAKREDLKPGTVLSKRVLGEDIVLWQHGEEIVASRDFCPHRGVRLSLGWVNENTLVCPYHGLAYNSQGDCVHFPSHPNLSSTVRTRIPTYAVCECYGLIWICLGNPTDDIIPFREWYDSSYRSFLGGPYYHHCSAPRVIENFLDVAHNHFLHRGILGDPRRPEIEKYQVEWENSGFSFSLNMWEHDLEGNGAVEDMIRLNYQFKVDHPLSAYFQTEPADTISSNQRRLAIFYTATPISEEECMGWILFAMNFGHDIPEAEMKQILNTVVQQDIEIVESQRPLRLPLDLKAEVHLPCDAYAIAYRKLLKQLGISFGVELSTPIK